MTNSQGPAVDNPGIFFKLSTVITLTDNNIFDKGGNRLLQEELVMEYH